MKLLTLMLTLCSGLAGAQTNTAPAPEPLPAVETNCPIAEPISKDDPATNTFPTYTLLTFEDKHFEFHKEFGNTNLLVNEAQLSKIKIILTNSNSEVIPKPLTELSNELRLARKPDEERMFRLGAMIGATLQAQRYANALQLSDDAWRAYLQLRYEEKVP